MKPFRLTIYRDKKREWRWRLAQKNGSIMADSGEGYTRRFDAKRAAKRMPFDFRQIEVVA